MRMTEKSCTHKQSRLLSRVQVGPTYHHPVSFERKSKSLACRQPLMWCCGRVPARMLVLVHAITCASPITRGLLSISSTSTLNLLPNVVLHHNQIVDSVQEGLGPCGSGPTDVVQEADVVLGTFD
jgi:hypothetical protein